jgi:hypothetical protein
MTEIRTSDGGYRNDPISADEKVARLRLVLTDYSLEQLEDIGLVEWDRVANIVYRGPYFDEKHW